MTKSEKQYGNNGHQTRQGIFVTNEIRLAVMGTGFRHTDFNICATIAHRLFPLYDKND